MTDKKREFGDWQTPEEFALRCCKIIRDDLDFALQQIIERITTKLIRLTGVLSLGEVLRGVVVSHMLNWSFVSGIARNVKRYYGFMLAEIKNKSSTLNDLGVSLPSSSLD